MNKEKAISICAGLFTTHPGTREFHVCSDEQAFFRKLDADAHQRTLLDKEFDPITVTREEAEGSATKPETGKEKQESTPLTKEELEAQLKDLNEKLAAATHHMTKVATQKKIDAIQEQLDKLNTGNDQQ